MNTLIKRLALFSVLFLAFSALCAESKEVARPAARPTIVLVHGAFADSSSWNDVAGNLVARGFPVVAAANPLRSVKYDAAYLDALLETITGPVVLVGHSYGGMVISNVDSGRHEIKALVYVAAFAPETGETAAGLSARFPGSTLAAALGPPVALPDGSNDLYIQQARFHQQFAADVPAGPAAAAAIAQRPVTDKALNEASGPPAWGSIPSWSVFGSLDRNIPPESLRFMARRARSHRVVEIDGASHLVMVSHPDEVARLIVEAAESR
ncbi:alpha/beta fold hydrolase [Luteimonas lutimaris]|uniref:Alpha/beta hydrolase n=1 Tax=Luteimonas lutimaris TaxID=698645 RepID=A0ABP7MGZ8_9GAMM